MQNIILTKGLPASGKTTWARKFTENSNGKVVNICKDDLRLMLGQNKFSKDIEELCLLTRDNLTELALLAGKDVIWSDTNLAPQHELKAKELAAKYNVKVQIKDFTHVSMQECLQRNASRANPVPTKVIYDMHRKFLKKPFVYAVQDATLPRAIICDIDGTIAELGKRNPYDQSTCYDDEVIEPVCNLMLLLSTWYKLIFMSGREEPCRFNTLRWLKEKAKLPVEALYLNQEAERRSSTITKTEMFKKHIKGKYYISYVIEDRDKNIRAWQELGLCTLTVGDDNFF